MEYKYNGIILNKKNVGETDRIYTLYTLEMGRIRILAKSVRLPKAKLAPFLEPLTQVEIFLAKTKGLGKITGAIVVNNFSHLKADLEATSQALFVLRIMEKMIREQEEDEKIFTLLQEYLEALEKLSGEEEEGNELKKNILTLGFLFKFFGELGYQLEVEKCVKCGKKLQSQENYFSASLGGVLGGECARAEKLKLKMNDDSIKFIRIFLKNKIANLVKLNASEKNVMELKGIFQSFFHWISSESGMANKGYLW
jgi:DNA repair protein RecO (recombination protein O)